MQSTGSGPKLALASAHVVSSPHVLNPPDSPHSPLLLVCLGCCPAGTPSEELFGLFAGPSQPGSRHGSPQCGHDGVAVGDSQHLLAARPPLLEAGVPAAIGSTGAASEGGGARCNDWRQAQQMQQAQQDGNAAVREEGEDEELDGVVPMGGVEGE